MNIHGPSFVTWLTLAVGAWVVLVPLRSKRLWRSLIIIPIGLTIRGIFGGGIGWPLHMSSSQLILMGLGFTGVCVCGFWWSKSVWRLVKLSWWRMFGIVCALMSGAGLVDWPQFIRQHRGDIAGLVDVGTSIAGMLIMVCIWKVKRSRKFGSHLNQPSRTK